MRLAIALTLARTTLIVVAVAAATGCADEVIDDGPTNTGGDSGDGGAGAATGDGGMGGVGGVPVGGGGAGGSAPTCIPTELAGVKAEYLFSGNADDTSGLDNHGIVTGPILTTDRASDPDSAYEFDGLDDEIRVSSTSDHDIGAATSSLTIEAWVYPTEVKTQGIVRKGSAAADSPFTLGLAGNGEVVARLATEGGDDIDVRTNGYDLNTWTHVAVTWDGSDVRLYVNARLEASEPFAGPMTVDTSPLLIGTRLQLPADTFAGKIDDIRLIDAARSQCEICQDAGISDTPECP